MQMLLVGEPGLTVEGKSLYSLRYVFTNLKSFPKQVQPQILKRAIFKLVFCFVCLVSDSATPWTVAHQAPLSMGFPRQEYWNGCYYLFQRIFPARGWNSHAEVKKVLVHRSHQYIVSSSVIHHPTFSSTRSPRLYCLITLCLKYEFLV